MRVILIKFIKLHKSRIIILSSIYKKITSYKSNLLFCELYNRIINLVGQISLIIHESKQCPLHDNMSIIWSVRRELTNVCRLVANAIINNM